MTETLLDFWYQHALVIKEKILGWVVGQRRVTYRHLPLALLKSLS